MDEESELTWSDEEEELWQTLEERNAVLQDATGTTFQFDSRLGWGCAVPLSLFGLIWSIMGLIATTVQPMSVVKLVLAVAMCRTSLLIIRRGRTHAKLSAKRKIVMERLEHLPKEDDDKES